MNNPEIPNINEEIKRESLTPKDRERLPEKIIQNIVLWSSQWLRDLYESNKERDGAVVEISEKISSFLETSPKSNYTDEDGGDFEDRNPAYDEAIGIFLGELAHLCLEKAADSKEQKHLSRFGKIVARSLFGDDNIFSDVDLGTAIIATAKVTRIPEVQESLGQEMTWATSMQFIEADDRGIDEPIRKILSLSLPDFLDTIHQLQTLGAHGAGSGDAEITMQIYSRKILETLGKFRNLPLTDYALDLAQTRLKEDPESINPLLGGLNRKEGARIAKSLTPAMSRVSRVIHQTIIGDRNLKEYVLLPIASDAIAAFDHSLLPRFIGQIDVEKVMGEYKLSNPPNRHVHLIPYNTLNADENLNPFANTTEEDLPLLLQHLHEPDFRKKIESDLGINFAELPLRSQIHFLRFLADQDRAGFDRLRSILTARPEQANAVLNCFLANAEDPKYAEAILTIAENANPEVANMIFEKYRAVVTAADEAQQYLTTHLPELANNPAAARNIRNTLLHRANELLAKNAQTASATTPESMRIAFEQIRGDILLFATTFKIASAEQPLTLEQIRGVGIEMHLGTELADGDRETMFKLYETTHQDLPLISRMLEISDFKEKLNSPIPRFYIIKHNGTVVGFMRFENRQKGYVYIGSFNVDENVQKHGIGEAFLRAVLTKENQESALEGLVNPEKPWLRIFYEKTFGFEFTGETERSNGITYTKMVLPKGALQRQKLERAA